MNSALAADRNRPYVPPHHRCRISLTGHVGVRFVEPGTSTCSSRDILSSPLLACIFFCLPAIAMAVTGNSRFANGWRTAVWTASLCIMGTACMVNAARCGRVHCYITGPFFLLMAILTLLYGLGIAPLGANGWTLLGLIILVGAVVFSCLPEMLFSKYRKLREKNGDH